MMKRNRQLAVLAILLLVSTACMHKAGGGAITPWERITTYNATLAQANNTVEQGVEAAVTSGVLSAQNAQPIIAWTGQVATLHQQITAILATGQSTTANVAAVQALVDQMKASLDAIPPGALGIKNPKSQQTFKADADSIFSLADAVLTNLKAVIK